MRILAIRGKNLTSLEGPFELDLEHGPLGDAGLFAIAGPTGAGKSTLLDALCIALYNKTPRLGGQGGVEVGRGEGAMRGVPANDPRNLLRDGAGEGWAEVDFAGREGRRWRSRWTVRRARGRADGKLQAVELVLEEIGGARAGGTLTETLAVIERELGLDFDQFRRAVLLAQGDFAAFLRAKAADRASLLEQMTGTKIYGELSTKAWERTALEQKALDELKARLSDAVPADDDARAALEAAAAAAAEARATAEAAVSGRRIALAWHRTAEVLGQDVARARVEREGAEAAREALADTRAELAGADAAEPARGAVEALDAALRRAEAATDSAAEQSRIATLAEAADAEARSATTLAEGALAEAEARQVAAAPALHEARAADVRVTAARQRADEADRDARAAAKIAQDAAAGLAEQERQRVATEARSDELARWLDVHARTAAVAAVWGELQVHLGVLAAESTKRDAARAALPGLESAAAAALAAYTTAVTTHEARRVEADAARATADAARVASAALDDPQAGGEDRPLRRARLQARRDGLARCGELLGTWIQLGRERATELEGVRLAQAAAVGAEQTARAAADTHKEQAARLSEARDGLRRVQAALDLTGHRATLVDGEPCPLCGATAHPWADASPVAALVDDAAGRVTALEAEVARLVTAEAAARTKAAADLAEAERGRARVAATDGKRAALARGWTDARVAPAPDQLPDDHLPDVEAAGTTLAEALSTARVEVGGQLERLAAEEREAERLGRALVDALHAAQVHAGRVADAVRAAEVATRAKDDVARAVADAREAAAEADRRAAAALDAAAPAFPDDKWRVRATADAAAFRDGCAAEVAAWKKKIAEREEVDAARARLAITHAAATAAATERAEAAARAADLATAAIAARGEIERVRAGLLDGAPVEIVEAALARGVTDARLASEDARALARRRAEAATATRAAAIAAEAERARREAERADARAAVDRALADLALDEPALRARLLRDRRWRDATRTRVADADRAVAEAVTREAERIRAADAHAATDAPAEDRATLEAALPGAEAAHRTADDGWTAARAALLQDDDRRARAAALLPAIDAQTRITDRWKVINKLIGSASGNVFRQFAQSLTLNLLLVESNVQLAALSRRYQLQRVPNVEMELQVVDLHMAEQVRPLTSLSGGETFLVSLALALGLAALAATRTRVESIFIDEGFGTLDADTLDVALSTLEGLRAEGRTVGVISHVGGLAERLGTWVSVEKAGPGRSRVRVVTG